MLSLFHHDNVLNEKMKIHSRGAAVGIDENQQQHFIAQKHKTCACARTKRSYARH